MWDVMTTVSTGRGARTIIRQLTVQAQVMAEALQLPVLLSKFGTKELLAELDRKFDCEKTSLLQNTIERFFDFS